MYDPNEPIEAVAASQLKPLYDLMMREVDRVQGAQLSRADDDCEAAVARFFLAAASLVPELDAPSRPAWHTIGTLVQAVVRPAAGVCDWRVICERRTGALMNLGAIGSALEASLEPRKRHMRYMEPIDQLLKEGVNRRQIAKMYGLVDDYGRDNVQAIYDHEAGKKKIATPAAVEIIEARDSQSPPDCSALLSFAHMIARELEEQPAGA